MERFSTGRAGRFRSGFPSGPPQESPSPLGCLRRASGPLGDLIAANLFSAAFLGGIGRHSQHACTSLMANRFAASALVCLAQSRSSAVIESPSGITVIALTHDLVRKRSIVMMTWDTDAEKKLGLPVPYGCSLDDVRAEAEAALRALSAETAKLTVK